MAGRGERFGAAVLDWVIPSFTFWVPWLIWFAIVARKGQTPGKQLLGIQIVRATGEAAGARRTWIREIVCKWVLFYWLPMIPLIYVLAFIFWSLYGDQWADDDQAAGMALLYSAMVFAHLIFGLASLWVLRDSRRQAVWDKIARTFVTLKAQPRVLLADGEPLITRANPGPSAAPRVAERLRQLGRMRDEGLISRRNSRGSARSS